MMSVLFLKIAPFLINSTDVFPKFRSLMPLNNTTHTSLTFENFSILEPAENKPPELFVFYTYITHIPHSYVDAECNYIQRGTSFISHHLCGMTILERLVERLRQIGVYDSSMIVMLSDHGPPLKFVPAMPYIGQLSTSLYNLFKTGTYHRKLAVLPNETHRMIPLLMIKYPGAQHQEMVYDYRAASTLDMVPTICNIKGWCGDKNTFDGIALTADAAKFKGRKRKAYNLLADKECWPDQEACFSQPNQTVEFDDKLDIINYLNTTQH
jgi:hypothetical protein